MRGWRSRGDGQVFRRGYRGALFGAAAVTSMVAAGSVLAADETVTVSKEFLEQLLANQARMEQEINDLKNQAQDNSQNIQLLGDQQNQFNESLDTAREDIPNARSLVKSGKGPKVQLSLSGQVNQGVLFADSGDEDGGDVGRNAWVVDNDNSSTRIRVRGVATVDEYNKTGAQIEVQFEVNSTADVNQDDDGNTADGFDNNFTIRKAEWWWDNETLGKLSVGQGDTASNGTSEVDLSGTTVINYSGLQDFAGGLDFRTPGGALTGEEIGDHFSNLDGNSRRSRVRYDSPTFAGFTVSSSWAPTRDGRWDVALRYAGEFDALGGLKVEAAGAWVYLDEDTNRYAGSASILHTPTGLSLTGAAGTDDTDGVPDPMFYYGKVAWETDLISWGSSNFSGDIYFGEDIEDVGAESWSYGAFFVQNVDAAAMELYVGWRHYELEDASECIDCQDIDAFLAGARMKF